MMVDNAIGLIAPQQEVVPKIKIRDFVDQRGSSTLPIPSYPFSIKITCIYETHHAVW